MPWQLKNDRQIWLQLAQILTQRIVSGLAAEAGVNPNTMQRALVYLEERGLVSAQRNTGRYVTQDAQLISDTRHALAQEELVLFCEKMRLLGFTPEETSQLLKSKGESE